MKLRMQTIDHDVYNEAKAVPDGWQIVNATYEKGYWKLLLVEHQPILNEWFSRRDHEA